MNKSLPIIIGVILVIAVGGFVLWQNPSATSPAQVQTTTTGTTDTSTASSTATTYTMAEVQQHNSATSCWSVIDGGVYDLTPWIPQHPGGERAIEGLCGIDGSTAFHAQHGTAARQENILAGFKIGTLSQ